MSITEKLAILAENTIKVHDAGKKSQWNEFWDNFQLYGARRSYNFAFINSGNWNKKTFKPKYDIILEGNASNAFYTWQGLSEPVDIGAILKEQGVTINTRNATNVQNLFAYGSSIVGSLPTIDLTSAGGNTSGIFNSVMVTTIEKLVVTEATNFSNMFRGCANLKNIVFEGTIATGTLSLSSCIKLTAQSLASVINALSGTTSGLSVTLPAHAKDTYDAAYGSGAWETLVATKSNWEITYA